MVEIAPSGIAQIPAASSPMISGWRFAAIGAAMVPRGPVQGPPGR
jgi:hypothetical protein